MCLMLLAWLTSGKQVGALYVFIINGDLASPSFLIISLALFVFIINGNLPLCCSYLFSEIPWLLLGAWPALRTAGIERVSNPNFFRLGCLGPKQPPKWRLATSKVFPNIFNSGAQWHGPHQVVPFYWKNRKEKSPRQKLWFVASCTICIWLVINEAKMGHIPGGGW